MRAWSTLASRSGYPETEKKGKAQRGEKDKNIKGGPANELQYDRPLLSAVTAPPSRYAKVSALLSHPTNDLSDLSSPFLLPFPPFRPRPFRTLSLSLSSPGRSHTPSPLSSPLSCPSLVPRLHRVCECWQYTCVYVLLKACFFLVWIRYFPYFALLFFLFFL